MWISQGVVVVVVDDDGVVVVVEGGMVTPTDFLVPSGKVMPWLTHLPSKYTLAAVVTDTPSIWVVVMGCAMEWSRGASRPGPDAGKPLILGQTAVVQHSFCNFPNH